MPCTKTIEVLLTVAGRSHSPLHGAAILRSRFTRKQWPGRARNDVVTAFAGVPDHSLALRQPPPRGAGRAMFVIELTHRRARRHRRQRRGRAREISEQATTRPAIFSCQAARFLAMVESSWRLVTAGNGLKRSRARIRSICRPGRLSGHRIPGKPAGRRYSGKLDRSADGERL